MNRVKTVSIESDFGAGKKGAKLGPRALLQKIRSANIPLLKDSTNVNISIGDATENILFPFSKNIDSILQIQNDSMFQIENVLAANEFPLILSGDHFNAVSAISAIKNHFPEKRLGVVWIDAHADLHSPYTTPSGNMHGMPLAAMLGIKKPENPRNDIDNQTMKLWDCLVELGEKKICPKIISKDLVIIDLRNYEDEEFALLNEKNIKFFTSEVIKEIGIETVVSLTLEQLSECNLIYVSFDVDSLDPEISIGTGTPAPGGLSIKEATYILKNLVHHSKTVALEITEINPLLDRENPMEDIALELLKKIFTP